MMDKAAREIWDLCGRQNKEDDMKLKQIKMETAQSEFGGCCDREAGPKVLQMTVQDEETGTKYYCAYMEIGPMEDFTVTSRNVLNAIANDYVEDVIPCRLETYTSTRDTWAGLPDSAFYDCYLQLKEKYAQVQALDYGTVHKSF